jgi:hypothetical protein
VNQQTTSNAPNAFEVRGYEVAQIKDGDHEWKQVAHYRNSERGMRHAASDARRLDDRWKDKGVRYQMRALVSVPMPSSEEMAVAREDAQMEVANDIADEHAEAPERLARTDEFWDESGDLPPGIIDSALSTPTTGEPGESP